MCFRCAGPRPLRRAMQSAFWPPAELPASALDPSVHLCLPLCQASPRTASRPGSPWNCECCLHFAEKMLIKSGCDPTSPGIAPSVLQGQPLPLWVEACLNSLSGPMEVLLASGASCLGRGGGAPQPRGPLVGPEDGLWSWGLPSAPLT